MARALPALRIWTPGDLATAAFMNAINYAIVFGCLQPPQLEVIQTITQTIATGATTALLWDTEIVDSDSFHSTSTNTDRMVAPWAAWYELTGSTGYAANATGRRGSLWAVNGTGISATTTDYPATASGAGGFTAKTYRAFLNAGDYAQLIGVQDIGSGLGTATGGVGSHAVMTFVSE